MNYFYDTCVLFVTHVFMLLHNIMYKMLRFYVCAKGLIFDPQKGTPKKASFVGPHAPWCWLVTCVMCYTRSDCNQRLFRVYVSRYIAH